MDLLVDGVVFEVSREDVRDRLRGRSPNQISKYWVEVDGVRWPVMQALRLVLRRDVYFNSITARHKFLQLGFDLGGGNDRPQQRQSVRLNRSRRFDPLALPEDGRLELSLAMRWRAAGHVVLDAHGLPAFPPLPNVSGVYRFEFSAVGRELPTVYIGESKDLAKRAGHYRNAKVDRRGAITSRRIHKELIAHLGQGGSVRFLISTEVFIDGDDGAVDLDRTSTRRVAENAAVYSAQVGGDAKVINVDVDPFERA